jgi:hypothetical protein
MESMKITAVKIRLDGIAKYELSCSKGAQK